MFQLSDFMVGVHVEIKLKECRIVSINYKIARLLFHHAAYQWLFEIFPHFDLTKVRKSAS